MAENEEADVRAADEAKDQRIVTYVWYIDHSSAIAGEWLSADDIKTRKVLETHGIIIKEDDTILTVGMNRDPDNDTFCFVMNIVKSAILHRHDWVVEQGWSVKPDIS